MANVTSNGALKKQSQSNCNFFNLNCHQPAQLYRPEIITFDRITPTVWCLGVKAYIDLVVAMSSLGVASSSLAVSSMVRPSEVDSPPFTRLISCMKKSG